MQPPEKNRVLRYHMPAENNLGAFPARERAAGQHAAGVPAALLQPQVQRPAPGLPVQTATDHQARPAARSGERLEPERQAEVRMGLGSDFQQLSRWLKALFSPHPATLLDLAAESSAPRPAVWLLAPELLLLPLFSLGYYAGLYSLYWPQTAFQSLTGAIYGNGLAAALLLAAACYGELLLMHLLAPAALRAGAVLRQTTAVLLPLALAALPGGLLLILWPASGSVLFLAAFAAHEALLWRAAGCLELPDRLHSVWVFCALSLLKWLIPFAYLGLFQ